MQNFKEQVEKKSFNEQCLIIEENSKRGKTSHLPRKLGNIKGASRPDTAAIKDRKAQAQQVLRRSGGAGKNTGKDRT